MFNLAYNLCAGAFSGSFDCSIIEVVDRAVARSFDCSPVGSFDPLIGQSRDQGKTFHVRKTIASRIPIALLSSLSSGTDVLFHKDFTNANEFETYPIGGCN